MADTLTWTAYNGIENIKKFYYKWTWTQVLHNWIDEAEYQAAMDEKDAEYAAMVEEKDQAYNTMVAQKNAEIANANAIVTYSSGTNYNRDWGSDFTWYDGDTYALIYRSDIWKENGVSNHIRIDNWTKYLFWGFRHIYWSNKWSSVYSSVAPFCYYIIDKSTNKMTQGIQWWYQTKFWGTGSNRVVDCIMPSGRIEYQTEYRAYYAYNNSSRNYADRCGSCIWYFYIKKDFSAMWRVAADDKSWRNSYWYMQEAYADVDYNRTAANCVSDYNTNKIGNYDSSNVRFKWKLYTATSRSWAYNSSDGWYAWSLLYTITN